MSPYYGLSHHSISYFIFYRYHNHFFLYSNRNAIKMGHFTGVFVTEPTFWLSIQCICLNFTGIFRVCVCACIPSKLIAAFYGNCKTKMHF